MISHQTMIGVVSGPEMSALDRQVVELTGMPSLLWMENAGSAAVEVIRELMMTTTNTAGRRKILIVCGTGNNGADGLVVARKLASLNFAVSVILAGGGGAMKSEEGRKNFDLLKFFNVEILDPKTSDLSQFAVIVDALLGVGARNQLSYELSAFTSRMNRAKQEHGFLVVSLDVPTGVCASSGKSLGSSIQADVTVTFGGLIKAGLLFYPGRQASGRIVCAQISFPQLIGEKISVWMNPVPLLLPRKPHGHKSTFGRALFIAGSEQYFGAPLFASLSFLKAGGGYAALSCTPSVSSVVASRAPEVVMVGDHYDLFLKSGGGADVVVIGPGLGLDEKAYEKFKNFIRNTQVDTFVIDGDGLTLLSLDALEPHLQDGRTVILTPHKGEWKRMFKIDEDISDHEMMIRTQQFLEPFKSLEGELIFVCKGPTSAILSSKGQTLLNVSGNASLATCGSGDVLTGLIAALLCNPPVCEKIGEKLSSVAAAVFVHGLAGDLAQPGTPLTASELMERVPEAVRQCMHETARLKLTYLPRLI